jgi:hypothetical protein
LAEQLAVCYVLSLIGGRMTEMPSSGYTLIDMPEPKQALVRVHPGAEELGRVNTRPAAFVAPVEGLRPQRPIEWSAETRREYDVPRTVDDGVPRGRPVDPNNRTRAGPAGSGRRCANSGLSGEARLSWRHMDTMASMVSAGSSIGWRCAPSSLTTGHPRRRASRAA